MNLKKSIHRSMTLVVLPLLGIGFSSAVHSCNSDVDCGPGDSCTKLPGQTRGVCVRGSSSQNTTPTNAWWNGIEGRIWGCQAGIRRYSSRPDRLWLIADGENSFIRFMDDRYEAQYKAQGLLRRWDWGTDEDGRTPYAVVLQPDDHAIYYDFSSVDPGESKKGDDVFTCVML